MAFRDSTAWIGSLAQPPNVDTKFSTVALGNGSRGRMRPGLFDGGSGSRASGSRGRLDSELRELQGLTNVDQGWWSITVAEGPKARSRSRKPDPILTIYVSTPVRSLTLFRRLSEIVDFEARLRVQFPGRLSSPKPSTATTPVTSKKRNNVLASLTRTLSPRRGGPISFTSFGAAKESRSSPDDLKEHGSILTKASQDSSIRGHAAWGTFFAATGKDDLESARVERRVKRVKSDPTNDIALTSVVPPVPTLAAAPTRNGRQDASNESAVSTATDELVKVTTQRLSIFDLPDIPSPTIKMDAPVPAEDVELTDAERREASDTSAMSDVTPTGLAATVNVSSVAEPASPSPPSTPPVLDGLASSPSSPKRASLSLQTGSGEATVPVEDEALPSSAAIAAIDRATPAAEDVQKPTSEQIDPPSADEDAAIPLSRSLSRLASTDSFEKKPGTVTIDSFDLVRVLGKGCAGKVLLVKEKKTQNVLALKAITKRHVLAHRELLHTRTEQSVLKTCARDKSNPFVVKLHYSFHDTHTLYLALDFHSGGDLATQLARWGRLGKDRARFYTAEICEGVEGLHRAGVIYRDLKPENILISHDGHIVLTDFGLSKDFGHTQVTPPSATLGDGLPRPHWLDAPSRSASTPPGSSWLRSQRETTTSFCGTAEYLAPEVLLGEAYSYEVDTWSIGTMLYEMLAGTTPYWAEDHATMYRRVLHDDLVFDDPKVFDDDTKSLIRGMLQRDPHLRISDARIKRHRYFNLISWDHILNKRYLPPFVPDLDVNDPTDVSQFDDAFLSMPAQVVDPDADHQDERDPPNCEPQPAFDEQGNDVFDGYSYFGRDSASMHRHQLEEDEDDSEELVSRDEVVEVEEPTSEISVPTTPVPPKDPSSTVEAAVEAAIAEETEEAVAAPEDEPETPHVEQDRFITSTPPPTPPHEREPSSDLEISLEGPGDLTLSSVNSSSTIATTIAEQPSPTITRTRQPSSRSNLAPLPEERPAPAGSAEVLVEEPEDPSDSEWDVVDNDGVGMSVRNGGREATFFSRGIKDRYRLVLAPLSSPLRPPPASRTPRQNSRHGSSSSAQSGLSLSPYNSITQEAAPHSSLRPLKGIRRFASVRSSTGASGKTNALRTRKSQRSLGERDVNAPGSKTAPPSPSVDSKLFKQKKGSSTSTSTLPDSDPSRRSGQGLKKFAKSAFLYTSRV